MYQVTFPIQVWQIITAAIDVAGGIYPIYSNRVYDTVPIANTEYPCMVYQSQDLGGQEKPFIGSGGINGWEGFVTFRSIHTSLSGAWNLLAMATQYLAPDITVSGFVTLSGAFIVQFRPTKPIPFPVESLTDQGALYQAGVLVKVTIYPSME